MSIDTRVKDYFSAFERKDSAAWLALFADDASLGGPAHTPPVVGRAALGELFNGIAALFETVRFEIVAIHMHGPFAVAEFKLAIEGRPHGQCRWHGGLRCRARRALCARRRVLGSRAGVCQSVGGMKTVLAAGPPAWCVCMNRYRA